MDAKLHVGNLAFSTTEDELRALFAQAGAVGTVDLIKDKNSGQSKGFAFIVMGSDADAQKAISMFNGHTLAERQLKVSVAKAK